jgi:hypothetical protein
MFLSPPSKSVICPSPPTRNSSKPPKGSTDPSLNKPSFFSIKRYGCPTPYLIPAKRNNAVLLTLDKSLMALAAQAGVSTA